MRAANDPVRGRLQEIVAEIVERKTNAFEPVDICKIASVDIQRISPTSSDDNTQGNTNESCGTEEAKKVRDDFSSAIIEMLAKRVGFRCSNQDCDQLTSGPQLDPMKSINVGVASHITAASPNGPRYNASLTTEQRRDIGNGIWLCQKCGKLVDSDEARYTVEQLREWKRKAEERATRELQSGSCRPQTTHQTAAVLIQGPNAIHISGPNAVHLGPGAIKIEQNIGRQDANAPRIARLEQQMPELLAEMRNDLKQHPLRREFVLLKKSWAYWPGGSELVYFFDDHDELESKVRILQNLGLVRDIKFNSVERFNMTEGFVEYLTS